MFALAPDPNDEVQCPTCPRGSGEIGTGEYERSTGAPITRRCPDCYGAGTVTFATLVALTAPERAA